MATINSVKIDKNVPIPVKTSVGRSPKHPFHMLTVGDSFCASDGVKKIALYAAACRFQKVRAPKGWAFLVEHDDKGVLRCWRTA